MSLGRTIAQLRKEKGWTQAEFGEKLDVHQSHVTRWESDRVRPRDSSLEKIAEVLEVSVEELYNNAPEVLASSLNIDDPELVEMLVDIPKLHTEELQALKTVLRNFLSQLRIREALAR
jgi:transcriptional regulator with XRE-family HTH domain